MYPEWFGEAEALYIEEELSYTKIGEKLGVNRKDVSFWLREAGYKSNLKYYPNVDPSKYAKYSIDNTVFENIDSEEKAYWLGFLYADGSVSYKSNVIEVGLKEEDRGHLLKFANFMKTDKPITEKYRNLKGKRYKGYRIQINNKKVKEDLIALGCVPRKTFLIQFPTCDIVPHHLINHFIRGYFDGDGCITKTTQGFPTAEILGTEMFLQGILNWSNANHQVIHSFNHSDIKRIQFFGKDAYMVLQKLYGNASIYLDRKYQLYEDIIAV